MAMPQGASFDPEAILSAGLQQRSAGETVYVLFTGDWCPDCRRTEAGVVQAASDAGVKLIKVFVGPPQVWRNPAGHPFRQRLNITNIPTLVQWTDAGITNRLGKPLENAPSAAAARQLVEKFIAS